MRSRGGEIIRIKDKSGISPIVISIILIVVLGIGLVSSLACYHSKVSTLKSEKIEALENLGNLKSRQKILRNEFENLVENHSKLTENHKSLKNDFQKIKNDYRILSENYLGLKSDYGSLKENYQSLKNSHLQLDENYQRLKENYFVLENSYENLKDKYSGLEEEYSQLKELKYSLCENYEKLKENYERVENELSSIRKGNRYELHDPTYNELKGFLEDDKTDENVYTENTYACFDFSKDLIANALAEGLMVGFVRITCWENHQSHTAPEDYRNYYAHGLVGFKTIDEGLVYVEPQNDVILTDLNVGDSYWDEIEKNSSIDYAEWPKLIITDIDLIW